MRGLGYADVPAMVADTAGFDPDALAAEMRDFLAESETVYFAALRRFLAEIDIEQGDASRIDLEHVIRGEGWDRWFEAHRMLPAFRATLNGLGIDIDAQPSILLDIEPRPQKSARAFCARGRCPERRAPGHPAARRMGRLRARSCTRAATPSTSRTSTRRCRCPGGCSATTA